MYIRMLVRKGIMKRKFNGMPKKQSVESMPAWMRLSQNVITLDENIDGSISANLIKSDVSECGEKFRFRVAHKGITQE